MKCTICDGTDLTLLTNELRNSEGEVYFCADCDLGLLKPLHTDMKKYYDGEYREKFTCSLEVPSSDPEGIFNATKGFQQDRLDIIKPYAGSGSSLLDVGCSAGQFLSNVKDFFERCVGLELDSRCAAFVRERLGIEVKEEELGPEMFGDAEFDFATSFHVMEHTLDPIAFLSEMKRIVKPGGTIFIEVPNHQDPLLKLWKVPAYESFYYREAHTHYFSSKSLEKLCGIVGLEVREVRYLQDYNAFNHWYWHFNNAPQKDGSFGLSTPSVNFAEEHAELGGKVNELFSEFDRRYKQLLAEHEFTSNVFLVLARK